MAGLHGGAHVRRLVTIALVSTLVALIAMSAGRMPKPAAADQVADLRAQAAAIAQKLVQQQLEVDAYQQQYSVASATVGADAQAIQQVDQQIVRARAEIAQKTQLVRHTAIMSYVNDGASSSNATVAIFSGDGNRAQTANEYANIAAGNITADLAELHTAQQTLEANQGVLQQQEARDQADRARQAADLGQATATEQQLTADQAQVTGALATAVAQQTAARDAAAAAAVASAQRAAAPSRPSAPTTTGVQTAGASAATNGTPAPPAVGSGSTTDPALNPFLQCVVQAESGGNYAAVSPNGEYMGAFQFSQATWNSAALAAGRPDLVGVPPNLASKADQDTVAVALYALDGQQPWLGDRCSG
jgi:septal ring factor EnvC (AmiA/AmiB activator)